MSTNSIWPIDRTLFGATTPGQNGPGSDGNEGILCIPQNFRITGASPSDYLCQNQDTHWGGGGSYPSAEKQVVYSIAPANWTMF